MDWILPPDWTEPIVQRLEWLTEVLASHNETEQRIGYRTRPRCTYAWRCTARDDQARATLENLLSAAQAQTMNLPIWPDAVDAWTSLPAGTTVLSIATPGLSYAVGGRVGIINGLAAEFGTVQSLTSSTVTLAAGLADTWPAGTLIVPMLPARMDGAQRLTSPWSAVSQLTQHWRLESPYPLTPATESADYQGYPVLRTDASWSEGVTADFKRQTDVIDNQSGPVTVLDRSGFPAVQRSHRWVGGSRAERAAFLAWAGARYGRRVPLWLPSGQRDLKLLASIGASATVLTVEDQSYAGTAAGDVGRRHILIETTGGAVYYRRILGAATYLPGQEQITLDSALGVSLAPSDVASISFMRLSRLESDAIEIRHLSPWMAEAHYGFMSLREAA